MNLFLMEIKEILEYLKLDENNVYKYIKKILIK